MELSATTTLTTAPSASIVDQQGASDDFASTNHQAAESNSTNGSEVRPSNGNDSSQSHIIQKQQQAPTSVVTSLQTLPTEPIESKDNSERKNAKQILANNGIKSIDNETNDRPKVVCAEEQSLELKSSSQKEFSNCHDKSQSDTEATLNDLETDIKSCLDSLIDRIETVEEPPVERITTLSQSSSLIVNNDSYLEITSFISPVKNAEVDEVDGSKPKDIVTLKNLELTPSPSNSRTQTPEMSGRQRSKRIHSETTEPDEETPANNEGEGGRSKRQRKQTQLFQVVDEKEMRKTTRTSIATAVTPKPKTASSVRKQAKPSASKRAVAPSKSPSPELKPPPPMHTQVSQIPPDVIFYEKNDYLAIRNEENTFYLCQLTENVRVEKPAIKIKWLDVKSDGRTYFLTSHFDKIPQKSIIMPVILNKLKSSKRGEQLFSLDDQVKESIMERLKRSLNINLENEK